MENNFTGLHEECGVFGIYTNETCDVAGKVYRALFALQHRGQESCGIAVNDRGHIAIHKDLGLVPEVFTKQHLESLGMGHIAVGHVRYATTGNTYRFNAQPLLSRNFKGVIVLAHNGNLINTKELRKNIELSGGIFHTTSDTEVISQIITEERLRAGSIEQSLEIAMYRLRGAYSLVAMTRRKLVAARDPYGFRPLCIGKMDGAYMVSSESCALESIGAEFVRDVEPGEIVVFDEDGMRSIRTHCGKTKGGCCIFEHIYFARPDSVIDGTSVHKARLRAGAILAQDFPVEADVVIGVPDSGLDSALGYARESGIPYGIGFIKNRYIGRTFIQPTQGQRENSVRIKLNALRETVNGKRVVLVDDSIVRGTTSRHIVDILREAGATEVQARIAAPPFKHPCFFGTDVPDREMLIANKYDNDGIAKSIGVDSLGYLSVERLPELAKECPWNFCIGCFTGEYPIEVDEQEQSNDDPYDVYICE